MNPTIIIPTYTNTVGLLKLLGQLADYDGQVIVVDNKPSYEKKHAVRNGLKNGVYLPQKENVGFAKGVNVGAGQVMSGPPGGEVNEWLVIVNDDVVLPVGYGSIFPALVTAAVAKGWVAVSPVLKKPDGSVEDYGYKVLPIGRVEVNHIDPGSESGMTQRQLDSSHLDGLTAACLVIKKDVFEKVGGFDESFFAYLEDVDLFLRLKKQGYSFGIDPTISVIHEHQTTSKQMGSFKARHDLVNWVRIIIKDWGWKKIMTNLPGIIIERGRNVSGLMKKMMS